jgi:hypothetical protein
MVQPAADQSRNGQTTRPIPDEAEGANIIITTGSQGYQKLLMKSLREA